MLRLGYIPIVEGQLGAGKEQAWVVGGIRRVRTVPGQRGPAGEEIGVQAERLFQHGAGVGRRARDWGGQAPDFGVQDGLRQPGQLVGELCAWLEGLGGHRGWLC